MSHKIFEYFEKRVEEEERLAAESAHPVVRETHRRFADFYRERLSARSMYDGAAGTTDHDVRS